MMAPHTSGDRAPMPRWLRYTLIIAAIIVALPFIGVLISFIAWVMAA
jgi:hypothetical protein